MARQHLTEALACSGLLLALTGAGPVEPFRIGVVHGGPPDSFTLMQGATRAAAEVNRDGGINGHLVEIVGLQAATGAWGDTPAGIARLVFDEHVAALVGPIDGATAHMAAQIATLARIPLVTLASESSLTRAGSPWIFRGVADDQATAVALLDAAFTTPRGKNAIVVVPSGRAGQAQRQGLQGACVALGLQRIEVLEVAANGTAPSIALPEADVLMLWLEIDPALAWLAAVEPGSLPAVLVAPASLNKARFRNGFRVWQQERSAWDGRFLVPSIGTDPDNHADLIRDVTLLIATAARDTGFRPEALRRSLAGGSPFTGRTGTFSFDRLGDRTDTPAVGPLRKE